MMEGTGQTAPGPGQSEVHRGDPRVCVKGGGAPWPCHTPYASPPFLCARQSEEKRIEGGFKSFWFHILYCFWCYNYGTAIKQADVKLKPRAGPWTQPWRKHDHILLCCFTHFKQSPPSAQPLNTHTHTHTHNILNYLQKQTRKMCTVIPTDKHAQSLQT